MKLKTKRQDGYLEGDDAIVTWCVGHLVTMSYPEAYDPGLKRWSLTTLPFIPDTFRYEVIPATAKQFRIVAGILNRPDVDTIYVRNLSNSLYTPMRNSSTVKRWNRYFPPFPKFPPSASGTAFATEIFHLRWNYT